MKKTLLALAAIAASSAAMAQSTVTLFGVADLSVENVKGNKSATRVSSDNLSSSRFGLKGTEDIGGGVKGNFMLDSGVKVDTGASNNSARFFDRSAWLGLSGSFGELRLGRIDSAIGDIAGNVLSAQPYDDLKIIGTRAGDKYRRVDNTVTYIVPAVVPGLTATLQYSTAAVGYKADGSVDSSTAGAELAGASAGKSFGLSAKYVAGPISAGVGYLNSRDEEAPAVANASQKANATLVYAGYDLGVAKVTAYYDAETSPTFFGTATPNGTNSRRLTLAGAKVAVPVSPEFMAIVGASTARNTKGLVAGTDNVQVVTVKGIYSLSKRTSLYAMFTNVNNGSATTFGVDADKNNPPASGKVYVKAADTTRAVAVGVRHMF